MQYTVFGEVLYGLDVVDKIAEVEKLPGDRPKIDVKMSIEALTKLPKKKKAKKEKKAKK
jgi:peptidyl-prolyl cis-trans isomerase B (cyclophilin B)